MRILNAGRPAAAAIGAAAAMVLLPACSAAPNTTAPPITPTTATAATARSSTAPVAGPGAAAIAAYTAMWADVRDASLTADYRSPLLEQHASGAALSLLLQGVHNLQLQHLITKGAPVVHPTITSLTPASAPTAATIRDCFDDTHWLNYKTSGGLQNNVPGGHRPVTASLSRSAGTWKVTQLNVGAEGTC